MKNTTSLFVAADIHALHGSSNLKNVLSLVLQDSGATQPDTVLLGGDHVGSVGRVPPKTQLGGKEFSPMRNMTEEERRDWQPVFRLSDLRSEITDLLGEQVKTYFTYASHDLHEVNGAADFFSGPASFDGYHLYGISFCQMRYASQVQLEQSKYDGSDVALGSAETGAAQFTEWVNSLPDSKPIFVMSHLPLHAHRTDNLGAQTWVQAFNAAAERHDLFVFFGHNHTAEHLTPLERACYFVPAGSTLPVQGSAKEEQSELSIRFSYLNAGYIANGCGTLLTLTDENGDDQYDTLSIRRYSLTEENAYFGSTGYANPQQLALRQG